ncbi:PREDICTED: ly-6/neurotoxin-like protein 1 isoform X1 [Mandrillus leucophaeus]|uniref:ly-6/neurotoxin-like protein 1 isoform X1 n=1 Tax=Mandrillus leucophaeus TaxID=9568 RepID=UPI0005F452BB|nr:PREDICTED: ly-6/neurotoxin-like protein 1 isoform X1 [Mandrillus leucophaeus]
MTPLLALFLVVLMGLPLVQALDCHVCAYNGDNCFNPMRCPAMVAYCMTTRTSAAQALWCHQCTGFGGCSRGSRCPRDSTHCVTTATRVLSNIENLPLVTKMCHTGCPDIPSLGLGPYVSIACCQTSLCNHD